jgi:putative ABC transport system ATP-binding protein
VAGNRRFFGVLGTEEDRSNASSRALANDPDLVLADEPTANLDSSIGREVMRRLRTIAKARGQSVLIVSHDDRIREFVDRVLWLEDGEFRSERELVRDPVCRMEVDPEGAAAHATIDGIDYWFCAQGCRQEFEARHDQRRGDTSDGRSPNLSDMTSGMHKP